MNTLNNKNKMLSYISYMNPNFFFLDITIAGNIIPKNWVSGFKIFKVSESVEQLFSSI